MEKKQYEAMADFLEDFSELAGEFATDNAIDRKTAEVFKKEIASAINSKIDYGNADPNREYFTLDMLIEGYYHILENGGTAKDAFTFIMKEFGKTQKFIDDNKNYTNPIIERHLKNTVRDADSHPVQAEMKRKGTMDRSTLVSAKTPNQQLRRLSRQVDIHSRINILEQTVEKHEQDINSLKDQVRSLDNRVGKVEEVLTERELAIKLYKEGKTQKEIADHLQKSDRTIRRWVKDSV